MDMEKKRQWKIFRKVVGSISLSSIALTRCCKVLSLFVTPRAVLQILLVHGFLENLIKYFCSLDVFLRIVEALSFRPLPRESATWNFFGILPVLLFFENGIPGRLAGKLLECNAPSFRFFFPFFGICFRLHEWIKKSRNCNYLDRRQVEHCFGQLFKNKVVTFGKTESGLFKPLTFEKGNCRIALDENEFRVLSEFLYPFTFCTDRSRDDAFRIERHQVKLGPKFLNRDPVFSLGIEEAELSFHG